MCRFHNLRSLEIQIDPTQIIAIFFKLIKQFQINEQLTLFNPWIIWNQLSIMFEILPGLRMIKCANWIDLAAYKELIKIGQRLNKKLIIELNCRGSLINFPIDLVGKDRHIVDICFHKEEIFNEFEY